MQFGGQPLPSLCGGEHRCRPRARIHAGRVDLRRISPEIHCSATPSVHHDRNGPCTVPCRRHRPRCEWWHALIVLSLQGAGASRAAAIVGRGRSLAGSRSRSSRTKLTNGRCRHSGSTVVESIAPSFRKRFELSAKSDGARLSVKGTHQRNVFDRSGIPLSLLNEGKQNHNAISTPICGSNHL